jgi:hypothetical protein
MSRTSKIDQRAIFRRAQNNSINIMKLQLQPSRSFSQMKRTLASLNISVQKRESAVNPKNSNSNKRGDHDHTEFLHENIRTPNYLSRTRMDTQRQFNHRTWSEWIVVIARYYAAIQNERRSLKQNEIFFGTLTRTVIEVNKGQQNDIKSNNFLSIHFTPTPWLSGFYLISIPSYIVEQKKAN